MLLRAALGAFAVVAVAVTGFGIFRAVTEQRDEDAKAQKEREEEAARDRAIAQAQSQEESGESGDGWGNFGNFLRGLDEQILRVATLIMGGG